MTESVAGTTRSLLDISMNEMLCFVDWVYLISLNITIVFMLQLPNLVPTCYSVLKPLLAEQRLVKQKEDALIMP